MTISDTLRYFDQSEMEIYLHENKGIQDQSKKFPIKPVRRFASAMIFLGLIAGSVGILNYLDKSKVKDTPHPIQENFNLIN